MKKHLTTSKQLNKMGGRVETSKHSGKTAPIDLADFFTSDFVGSLANILNKQTSLCSGFQLPTPHGLRDNETKDTDMTNSISIYNFNQNQVRTATIDNQPYFNLNDCCAALGIARGYKSAVRLSADGVRETSLTDKLGRQQIAKFINEPNLYRLIFRSNKPQAQAFADWVYNEVLPSIRKTGSFGVPVPVQVDMKAIGGMVKKCCAVAVRDELKHLIADDFESDNWQKIIALMLTNRVNHLMEAKKQELITLIKQ